MHLTTMSNLGKHSLPGVIDLTGDENLRPRAKQPRLNPPSAAQPRPSQSFGSSQSSQSWSSSSQAARGSWQETSEEYDIIDLSQEDSEVSQWSYMGAIHDNIVGIRYYNGVATIGEQVMVKREPTNIYDKNSIRVNNVEGTQIGHIPRVLASKLAPLMVSHLFPV